MKHDDDIQIIIRMKHIKQHTPEVLTNVYFSQHKFHKKVY